MRLGILAWSALSGAVIAGVFVSLALGAATIALSLLPLSAGIGDLLERRGVAISLGLLLLAVVAGAVLGYLEGRLKLN